MGLFMDGDDADDGKAPLPGNVELNLAAWSQAKTCPGGRADDALIHLYTADKTFVGTMTLGWFREYTTLPLMERAGVESREEDQA